MPSVNVEIFKSLILRKGVTGSRRALGFAKKIINKRRKYGIDYLNDADGARLLFLSYYTKELAITREASNVNIFGALFLTTLLLDDYDSCSSRSV